MRASTATNGSNRVEIESKRIQIIGKLKSLAVVKSECPHIEYLLQRMVNRLKAINWLFVLADA